MDIHDFGTAKRGTVLLLHPMLLDGASLIKWFHSYTREDYRIIAPDFSGHGTCLNETFHSLEEELEALRLYCQQRRIQHFDLGFGMSLGGRALLELLKEPSLSFGTVVCDGVPAYRHAYFKKWLIWSAFHSRWHKIQENYFLGVEKINQRYGEDKGERMADTFYQMSLESLKNIVEACTHFDFPAYSPAIQRNLYFDYGSKDRNRRCSRKLKKYYPESRFYLRKGYGHCAYITENPARYCQWLESLMQKENH